VKFPKGTTEHPLNKTGKEEILVSTWDFGAVHPQSERSYYACNDHPAKMRPSLARAILQLYGESPVLDPMAGIGTTLVEAMLLGMNAVGVEYEKKFVKQANENLKHIYKTFSNRNLGKVVCIEGDARYLSCLNNKKVRSVLFSPPYFDAVKAVSTGHQGPEHGHLERQHKLAKEGKSGYGFKDNIGHAESYGTIFFSPPFFNALKRGDEGPSANNKRIPYSKRVERFQGYSEDKGNIGNILQFGSIVFSPPYFDALSIKKGGGSKTSVLFEETTQQLQMKRSGPFAVKKNLPTPYSSKQENIGNIAQFGSIVFSPPYFCSISDVVKSRHRYPKTKQGLSRRQEYSGDPGNIGNIAKFGSVIFSPPYADALSQQGGRQIAYMKGKKGDKFNDHTALPYSKDIKNIGNIARFGSVIFSPPYINYMKGYSRERDLERVQRFIQKNPEKAREFQKVGTWYNINLIENYPSPNNIGNLNCRTYLGEMLKVYRECYRVLKPGRFMVVVAKDIQRSWKTIPIGADTIKLCQMAGFDCHDIIISKMYFPSFWMLNLAKKAQAEANKRTKKFHALKCHEYVLVFRKPD